MYSSKQTHPYNQQPDLSKDVENLQTIDNNNLRIHSLHSNESFHSNSSSESNQNSGSLEDDDDSIFNNDESIQLITENSIVLNSIDPEINTENNNHDECSPNLINYLRRFIDEQVLHRVHLFFKSIMPPLHDNLKNGAKVPTFRIFSIIIICIFFIGIFSSLIVSLSTNLISLLKIEESTLGATLVAFGSEVSYHYLITITFILTLSSFVFRFQIQ